MKPWTVVDAVATPEGTLELRHRGGDDFLIVIGGRVLMRSNERVSEQALATLACAQIAGRSTPRVLIGGLGMAYTVRAALDALPPGAEVVVAELTPQIEVWCRGPLATLTGDAVGDPRVRIVLDDVANVIEAARPATLDAILLDLYEGPNAATQRADDRCYGPAALRRCHAALAPGGVLAVWSEDPDAAFERRFEAQRFAVTRHRLGKSRAHVVYVGIRR